LKCNVTAMDVTALLVFVSGFVVCAGVVFLISIFGAKEETYEEAIAKQKKANEKEKKSKDKKKDNENKKTKNWRMKKKEKDDKQEGLDDVEEEQVVLVTSGAKIEDVVDPEPEVVPEIPPVVEIKQAKKEKRKEKKKMEIQEVESVKEVKEEVEVSPAPIVESVPIVETVVALASPAVDIKEAPSTESPKPTKQSPVKQKVKKDKPVSSETPASVSSPKELLSIVKKTAFNDAEAQKLIDVLLTKQSGDSLNTSDEWIEKGKPTESQKLRQELNETLRMFEEEKTKSKSFSDKVTNMRKELNDERAAKSSHNKIIDEIQKKHMLEVSNVNNHLQQLRQQNEMLQGNIQQELHLRRNLEMNQATFQASIDGLNQQLEMAKIAAASAKANDPHLLTELEQLRTLRDKYENTLAEININNSNLKNQISQQTEEITNIKKQLSSSSEKVSQLANNNSSLEKALAAKTDEAKKTNSELESVKTSKTAITNNNSINAAELESELDSVKQKLAEKEVESRRLLEENERLAEQVSSALERPAAEGEEAGALNGHSESSREASQDWREKFEALNLEHEKILAKQKVSQADHESEVCKYTEQVEILKSKNNDLNIGLEKEKKSSTDLILRLFPSLTTSSKESSVLEQEAKQLVDHLGVGSEVQEKLESQVTHYKKVLAETEKMLTSLQTSVEAAESDWKLKLDIANRELITLKLENSKLSEKSPSTSNEPEMQEQLTELQLKLAKEEEDKGNVSKLNQDLNKEVERLSKELVGEQRRVGEMTRDFKEMETTNISLKQLVHTTQDALFKEQNLVKSFQEQLQDNKVGNQNGLSSETVH